MATMPPRQPSIAASTPSRIVRNSGPLEAGQVINGRYHVIRLLGKGGMGAVYHAWDEELGVGVALKVILPGPEEDREVVEELERRFKKELILARQITHRNVVRIHDIGEVDGVKFITMPYIKGEDLATMLKAGPMPVPRVLALAKQVVSGLAAAHDAGVVHRDLKPANIMIEEGEWALLMDFGIARSVRGGTAGHAGTLAGTVVGTVEYMAPEQARGEVVDARADIYALGLILYEMLTGRRSLAGEGAVSDLVARMGAAPPAVRTLKPEIPDAVDAIVTKCIQPAAAERFQSCAELLTALEGLDSEGRTIARPQVTALTPRVIALIVALIVTAAGLTYWVTGDPPPPPAARAPVSVLIADFDNKAKDPIFDGTLEQALGLAMEGASFISTYSRTSAQRVAGQLSPGATLNEDTARQVSTREGIQVVLAGSVALEDGEYELTVRALEGRTGKELSSARATADSKDEVLAAISRAAATVRRSLGDVTPESEQISAAETFTASSLEAARAYEEAQELQRDGDVQGAVAAYKRVIGLDPNLGRAYSGLASVYANSGQPEEADANYKLAMAKIDRMTEREKYRTRSGYYIFTRSNSRAIEELNALVDKYPGDTAALANLAVAYSNQREFGKAMELGRKAAAVYSNAISRTNVALFAMYASEFEEAIKEAEAALKVNDKHAKAYLALALSHLGAGRTPESAARYSQLTTINGSLATLGLADLALYEGRAAGAASLLETGAAADGAEGNTASAARKLTALATARRLQGRSADAVRLVQQAVKATTTYEVKVEAALVYLDLGMLKDAAAMAADLRASLANDPQAYARVIDGLIQLARNQPREAVVTFTDAQKLADTWIGRFGLGRAYLELKAYTEAYAAFEACLRRRGEATALFLDDLPTYHLLPPVHYYMGLAQQGLGSPAASESFKTFLAIKQKGDDPLVADARKRIN